MLHFMWFDGKRSSSSVDIRGGIEGLTSTFKMDDEIRGKRHPWRQELYDKIG